jgi:hypothetical protein
MMKQTFEDDDVFSYNLSAFLSAARSITFHMQNQYKRRPGFAEWYCPHQIALSADAELEYLNDARVDSVHKKMVPTGAAREKSYSIDAIIVDSADAGHLERAEAELTLQSDPKTVRRFFPEQAEMDILEFCERQLAKLTALVDDCERRFP